MNKEHPMIYREEMVLAILENRKTHTRRLDGLHEVNQRPDDWCRPARCDTDHRWIFSAEHGPATQLRIKCPWSVGDRIWVRETFLEFDRNKHGILGIAEKYAYRASTTTDGEEIRKGYGYRWIPSIHMPRQASRILLEIVSIRLVRLHEITESEAVAEGVQMEKDYYKDFYKTDPEHYDPPEEGWYRYDGALCAAPTAVLSFESLWQSIYGARPKLPKNTQTRRYKRIAAWLAKHPDVAWAKNPYVWAIEFRRVS